MEIIARKESWKKKRKERSREQKRERRRRGGGERGRRKKIYDAISLVTIARPGELMISTRNYGLIRGKLLRVLIAVRSVFPSEHGFSRDLAKSLPR